MACAPFMPLSDSSWYWAACWDAALCFHHGCIALYFPSPSSSPASVHCISFLPAPPHPLRKAVGQVMGKEGVAMQNIKTWVT